MRRGGGVAAQVLGGEGMAGALYVNKFGHEDGDRCQTPEPHI